MSSLSGIQNTRPRGLFLIATGLALVTIVGAWAFEILGGYRPCPLCLTQRNPYYIGLALMGFGLIAATLQGRARLFAGLAALTALVFSIGVGYGIYHSGVEWAWWPGPASCGAAADPAGSITELLNQIETQKVVRCDEVQWQFLGLSFANYNVLISLAIVGLSTLAGLKAYGSSSVSQ